MPDPLFFVPQPHSDLHAVVNGPRLTLDVLMASRNSNPAVRRNDVNSVFNKPVGTSETFSVDVKFLAQHEDPPNRFANAPTVDANGLVTVTTPGVFLFQIKVSRTFNSSPPGTPPETLGSVVGRLQVHPRIVDWWFGNTSITTARDDIPHAQPTIYARFEADQAGTDLVGDITGHDYVPLVSADTTRVVVGARGRLRGVIETAAPVKISGTLAGKTHDLDVRVVDYARTRGDELKMVRLNNTTEVVERSNIVFVAEGFRDTPADRALFSATVKTTSDRMFTMPRHDPFSMLGHRFNVFELFAPSQDQGITTGFPVTHVSTGLTPTGLPMPFDGTFTQINTTRTLAQLVQLVGMPRRGETRSPADLKLRWKRQRPELSGVLDGFPDALITEWKAHRAEAFLDARDSRFGMHLGGRFADADTPSTTQVGPVANPPATDDPTNADMVKFVNRVYSFFTLKDRVRVSPDPRRHPPQLFGSQLTSPVNSILTYVAGQTFTHPFDLPGQSVPLGREWVPDDTRPTLSRGQVVIVAYEDIRGGVALNNATMVGVTVGNKSRVALSGSVPGQQERLNRVLPAPPAPPITQKNMGIVNLDFFTNVVPHELGHQYSLGDEYEVQVAADPDEATFASEHPADNITNIGAVRDTPTTRGIDANKVNWFVLPRMRIASRLVQTAQPGGGSITVRVNPGEIPKWTKVFTDGTVVSLRRATDHHLRRQLPLAPRRADQFQDNLRITRKPNPDGTIVLSFTTGLPNPPPQFPAGSALFVPQMNGQTPVLVVEDAVLNFVRTQRRTLNTRPNPRLKDPNVDPEAPNPVPGFVMPARNTFRVVGIYEGGNHASRGYYRPTGSCKMRHHEAADEGGAFCFVCRWLLVNVVDPGRHEFLDTWYPGGRHG